MASGLFLVFATLLTTSSPAYGFFPYGFDAHPWVQTSLTWRPCSRTLRRALTGASLELPEESNEGTGLSQAFDSVILRAARQGDLATAKRWHKQAIAAGMSPSFKTLTELLRAAAKKKVMSL